MQSEKLTIVAFSAATDRTSAVRSRLRKAPVIDVSCALMILPNRSNIRAHHGGDKTANANTRDSILAAEVNGVFDEKD
jgi:hypothetical protein